MMFTRSAPLRFRWLLMPLLLLSASLIPKLAWADPPPRQEWARLFGTAADDKANCIAVSRSGQVYATGSSESVKGLKSLFLAKFHNYAVLDWLQQWRGDFAFRVAVDNCEFVSVATTNYENSYFYCPV